MGRQYFLSGVLMMFCCMVLCPIVGVVQFPQLPVDLKLLLAFSVSETMELHVHCLGLFGLHLSIDDAIGHCIVGLE